MNTSPGLSGPLRIDFLRYKQEQLKNLAFAGTGSGAGRRLARRERRHELHEPGP